MIDLEARQTTSENQVEDLKKENAGNNKMF